MNNNKKDNQEVFSKVSINWYPGHMAKTRRQIEQDLKIVDIVIELLDARIPISSQNPDIEKITRGKKKIIVLNKCDLADEKKNQQWVQYFEKKGIPAVLTDSNSGKGIDQCIRKIENIMSENWKKNKSHDTSEYPMLANLLLLTEYPKERLQV